MYSVENKVGRLLEIYVERPFSAQEAEEMSYAIPNIVKTMNGRFVGCADFSRITIFPPDAVNALITAMQLVNAKLLRTAILISNSAVFDLQVRRLITSGGNSKRRSFVSAAELLPYLSEVLNAEEQARLSVFLDKP